MDRTGPRPTDIVTARDLGRRPVLERAALQRDPEYFAAHGAADRCTRLQSGGSTGEPVTIVHDPFALVDLCPLTVADCDGRPVSAVSRGTC